MKNDQQFLNNLTDFRDLKSFVKKQQDESYSSNKSSNISEISNNCTPQYELQMQSNDKLMKNFKDLRQQLKQSHKKIQKLNLKVSEQEADLERHKKNEKQHLKTNYTTKCEIQELKNTNEDYRSKFQYLQQIASKSTQYKQELQYLRMLTYELKTKLQKNQQQNKKILQISVIEKVQLEEKIKKMQAKKNSDLQYVQQMEIQISKLREKNIKLDNQLKKSEIRYDQQLYNKKWLNGNFERQHLQQKYRQLEKQNNQLISKNKKQKQKRNNLEKRVLQLEEMTGIWSVKAQTYEVENKNFHKKFKKTQKKMVHLKQSASTHLQQALSWQQRFLKSVSISQELISRVKRDLYGDTVSLAKSCQFKLTKLKQEKDPFMKSSESRKSPSTSKIRAKSKPLGQKDNELSPVRTAPNFAAMLHNAQSQTNSGQTLDDRMNKNQTAQYHKNQRYQTSQVYRRQHKQRVGSSVGEQNLSNTKNIGGNKQNNNNVGYVMRGNQVEDEEDKYNSNMSVKKQALAQIDNIDIKIRKERENMEKKIKQKMLYRKIQMTTNSPEKHQLREDYFRLINN